jgi:hypothetical protein
VTERKRKTAVPGRVFYEVAEVAGSLGWSTRRARRWLVSQGAARQIGKRWYTTKAKLRRAFGEDAAEVIAGLSE